MFSAGRGRPKQNVNNLLSIVNSQNMILTEGYSDLSGLTLKKRIYFCASSLIAVIVCARFCYFWLIARQFRTSHFSIYNMQCIIYVYTDMGGGRYYPLSPEISTHSSILKHCLSISHNIYNLQYTLYNLQTYIFMKVTKGNFGKSLLCPSNVIISIKLQFLQRRS